MRISNFLLILRCVGNKSRIATRDCSKPRKIPKLLSRENPEIVIPSEARDPFAKPYLYLKSGDLIP